MENSILAYIGALGGIAGFIGAIIAVRSYYLARSFRVLDVRLQSEMLRSDLGVALEKLVEVHRSALPSRRALFSATGMLNSGAMAKWKHEWDDDQNTVQELTRQAEGEAGKDYRKLDTVKLTEAVARLHSLKARVAKVSNRYEASLREDEIVRSDLRADRRVESQNRRSLRLDE